MLNFELILDMQKELDSKINNCRERTAKDIMISFIAELVEWNETTDGSHKTWKHNVYTKAEQFEEIVDCIFFIAQLFNHDRAKTNFEELKKVPYYQTLKNYIKHFDEEAVFRLLNLNALSLLANDINVEDLLISYVVLVTDVLGYTEEEIEEEYKRKHRINLERINKKREEGGWK